ncbi:MAG: nucleotide pyrophosphatase [Acidobacteria bacterium]|nr:MAG: nucleotide pyrophosphatase [Acidobacteriota bacterium]
MLVGAAPAAAYIGPGAGFAVASSFMVFFATFLIAIGVLLIWPFRTAWRVIRRKRPAKTWIKRLVVVGLDGQDPKITERLMAEGELPNFQKLAEQGCYRRIETTYPAISPVAWSSFSTGTNPGKHNIFDFLDRDLRSYLPKLSSAHIGRLEKYLRVGNYRIPLKKPEIRLLRKSKPFWTLLGERDIWSTILRVPITFPPDKFKGAQLAAMCVPDLLGTQGTFQLLTTRAPEGEFKEGGMRQVLEGGPEEYTARIEGPENTFRVDEEPMRLDTTIRLDRQAGRAEVTIGDTEVELVLGKLSDWVELSYRAVAGVKVHGLARLQLLEADEHVSLYVSPINISPEKPAMPVSHPSYYSTYLAKQVGPYATLGLAEDTWALNEKVTDDGTFLQQTYDIENERERMFFSALDRLREGSLVCVFDGTDRIQHMFWRYTEEGHPAAAGAGDAPHKDAITELYRNNDALVGRVMEKLRPGDLLMVLSDHGFDSFRRGINLNRWLLDQGLLTLKEGADGKADWLTDVDWSRTKAYSLGLAGIFLNLEGREASGIVKPGAEAAAVKKQIMDGLRGLRDEERGEIGINEAFDAEEIYSGPYKRNAPDLIIGYNAGYRTSWDCATGIVDTPVFEDNVKAWSGDHCIDPRLVPGVFFCSHAIDNEAPSLLDVAPTAMELFGLPVPGHMEGRPMFSKDRLPQLAKQPSVAAA